MSVASRTLEPDARADQRVVLHGVPWWQYEALLAMRGDRPAPRVTYLRGELELMATSHDHEEIKKRLARLVEAWAEERGVELTGVGSWTIRAAEAERGAEPDECYVLGAHGRRGKRPERPDLAIEVVWTHGGLDRLEVWRGLGVPEVWLWEDGAITVHLLDGDRWTPSPRSRLLPEVDLALLAELLDEETQLDALRRLRASLRGPPRPPR